MPLHVRATYRDTVETERYAAELRRLLDDLQARYGYGDLDAFLVLKDILAAIWGERSKAQPAFPQN